MSQSFPVCQFVPFEHEDGLAVAIIYTNSTARQGTASVVCGIVSILQTCIDTMYMYMYHRRFGIKSVGREHRAEVHTHS